MDNTEGSDAASRSYAEAAVASVRALSPADKSWIAAVVLIVAILELSDYLQAAGQYQALSGQLSAMEENRSEEIRSAGDTIDKLSTKITTTATDMGRILDRLGQLQARQQDLVAEFVEFEKRLGNVEDKDL